MKIEDKAKIIIEELEKYIQIDFNYEEFYLKAIKNALIKIEKEEKDNG